MIIYGDPSTYILPLTIVTSVTIIGLIFGIIGVVYDEKKAFPIIGILLCGITLVFVLIHYVLYFFIYELGY